MDKAPSGRQIAAARALVGMTQAELAKLSVVSVPTLKRMEASVGAAVGMPNNVSSVRRALEAAGVQFTNGDEPGVRLRKQREDRKDLDEHISHLETKVAELKPAALAKAEPCEGHGEGEEQAPESREVDV
jgi:transcriptional regulator with XRE-family HTH domain